MEEVSRLENAEEIAKIPFTYSERMKAIGREEGLEVGRAEGLQEVALKMLKDGFSIEKVAELTQLDKEKIMQLKNGL